MGAFESKKLGETRALGTVAGDLERQARRLSDKGYRREAGALMGQAAIERASKRGFGSADEDIQNEKLGIDVRQTVANNARKAILGDTQGGSMMQEARASRLDASPTPGLDATPASRLDASPTPGLDATAPRPLGKAMLDNPLMDGLASKAPTSVSPAPSDNLAQRKSLFAEMRAAGEAGTSDTFRQRAAALGVDDKGWNIASERLRPATPEAPRFGANVAAKNIATMGAEGAAADYFARARADEAAAMRKTSTAFAERMLTPEARLKPMAPGSNPFTPIMAAERTRQAKVPVTVGGKIVKGSGFNEPREGGGFTQPKVSTVESVREILTGAINEQADVWEPYENRAAYEANKKRKR